MGDLIEKNDAVIHLAGIVGDSCPINPKSAQEVDVDATKYIAKLRDVTDDGNIHLLKCKMEAAGHGGMSGRDNAITELAEEYSFILKTANILD